MGYAIGPKCWVAWASCELEPYTNDIVQNYWGKSNTLCASNASYLPSITLITCNHSHAARGAIAVANVGL